MAGESLSFCHPTVKRCQIAGKLLANIFFDTDKRKELQTVLRSLESFDVKIQSDEIILLLYFCLN